MGVKLVLVMKAHKLLGKGCEGFLCHTVNIEDAKSSLEGIPAVKEFPDVFADEISGMSPLREAEFYIDLTLEPPPFLRQPTGWHQLNLKN